MADLTEISSQIEAAVVLDKDGTLLGSTLADDTRSAALADAARERYSWESVAEGVIAAAEGRLASLPAP